MSTNATTQKVEIVGNTVSIVESQVIRTVSLTDFAQTMQTPGQFRTGALPRYCVEIDNRERSTGRVAYKALLQYPAEVKKIRHDEGDVEVLVPSRVYIVKAERSDGRVYASTYQYFAKEWVGNNLSNARIYHIWLPNRYSGGDLCVGSAASSLSDMDMSLNLRIDQAMSEIETAVYNNDLPECLDYRPNAWMDFCDWNWDREYDEDSDEYNWCSFYQLLLPWHEWYMSSEDNKTIHAVHDLMRGSGIPLGDYWS